MEEKGKWTSREGEKEGDENGYILVVNKQRWRGVKIVR